MKLTLSTDPESSAHQPTDFSPLSTLLNEPKVQRALGVPEGTHWEVGTVVARAVREEGSEKRARNN